MAESEVRIAVLNGFFGIADPDTSNAETEIEINRRHELAQRVRDEYVDLINTYGRSQGRTLQVSSFPNTNFKYFTITSLRSCPEIVIEDPNKQGVSIKVALQSQKHEDNIRKYYDPSTLTSIFPDDAIEFELWAHGVTSISGLNFKSIAFYIYPEQVLKVDSELGAKRMKEGGIDEVIKYAEDWTPSIAELESLIVLAPLLRERYDVLRVAIPVVETRPVKQLRAPLRLFTRIFGK